MLLISSIGLASSKTRSAILPKKLNLNDGSGLLLRLI